MSLDHTKCTTLCHYGNTIREHEATLQAAHDCQRVTGPIMLDTTPTASERFAFDHCRETRPPLFSTFRSFYMTIGTTEVA